MKMDIELSEEAEASIRNQAKLRGQDVSDYIVDLIDQWLDRQDELESRGEVSSDSK